MLPICIERDTSIGRRAVSMTQSDFIFVDVVIIVFETADGSTTDHDARKRR